MNLKRGLINFLARQLLKRRAIPFFWHSEPNRQIEQRADDIVSGRKLRQFKDRRHRQKQDLVA